MKAFFVISFFISTVLFSCESPKTRTRADKLPQQIDTLQRESAGKSNAVDKTSESLPKNLKPVFGFRFEIIGDFDGDGKREKLKEHFYSKINNKESNKFYENLSDYSQLVALTIKKEPFSFVKSDNSRVDTLRIYSGGQHLGLSYLKNEGDLNGDGTDEVSYVINWADWSNLNTWHLVTYQNKKWTELYSFPIWDWQLPDLPETFNQYGVFGLEEKVINTTTDATNMQIEKELSEFSGLIKKINTNRIQVIYRNDEAEIDTMMIDLKSIK
jgi:hypothetical protein